MKGCPMGGAISVIMSGIHMNCEAVKSCDPVKILCSSFQNFTRVTMMTLTKKNKNSANDEYFANMNSYHKSKINCRIQPK